VSRLPMFWHARSSAAKIEQRLFRVLLQMIEFLRSQFSGLRVVFLILLKHRRLLFGANRLPPGKLLPLYEREQKNRRLLLEIMEKKGPIFKARHEKQLMICIVGLPHCHQFAQENSSKSHMATVDLKSLFPHGFLRQMEGTTHKRYRSILVRGLASDQIDRNKDVHLSIIENALEKFRLGSESAPDAATSYSEALLEIASGLLIQTFFGYAPGSEDYTWLLQRYQGLGKDNYHWNIGENQKNNFVEIRDHLMHKLETPSKIAPQSILGRMATLSSIDETSLGNLIYMVEMGRHDMRGLFRWLSKYVSENPKKLAGIRQEPSNFPPEKMTHTRAFVLETLRMDQIERLIRIADVDLVFQGFTIPKDSYVRLCLWESHKDSTNFSDPFEFHATRFFQASYSVKQFAPFGIDHHQCPLGRVAIHMGMLLVKTLADHYEVVKVADGPPARELNQWRPAANFSISLKPISPRSL
jgi:cytochrome P450